MNFYTRSQIGSKVARIVRVAGKVDSELHVVLCSILTHTEDCGDYTAILPLLNGLPNGVRKQGIVAWLSHFSGKQLTARKDNKSKEWVCELAKGWTKDKFDLPGAYAITFGEFTQEPEPTTLSVKMLVRLLEKHATNTETNKDGSPKVSPLAAEIASKLVATARDIPEVKAALAAA